MKMFNWAQEKVEKVPREEIIAAAKLCGYWSGQTIEMNDVGIERLYAIAFEAGRVAGFSASIEACQAVGPKEYPNKLITDGYVDAIRARGDTK